MNCLCSRSRLLSSCVFFATAFLGTTALAAPTDIVLPDDDSTNVTQPIGGAVNVIITGPAPVTFNHAMHTYTGETNIYRGSALILLGQGRVSASSLVTVDGTFDVSAAASARVKDLTGSGSVILGENHLQVSAANSTFSGIISGVGGLMVTGGSLTLTGENTFTGGLATSAGTTATIGNGGTSGSITSDINNYGRVVFNRSDEVIFAGTITSNGAFEQIGTGTLILTADNSTRGNVTIGEDSTLQLGNGGLTGWIGGTNGFAGSISNQGSLIYNRSNNVSFAGTISGAGSVTKSGAGNLTLTGTHSYTGETFVNSGSLIVNGSIASSALTTVASGATLAGTGRVGSATIAAGGVHTPGTSVGTQYIDGNYTNAGTLRVEGTPSSSDMLVVSGAVDISGATLDLVLSPTTPASWDIINGPFTLINSTGAGAITGSFASVTNDLLFLDHSLDYFGGDGNDLTLELARNDVEFAAIASSPNQSATAGAIDSLGTSSPLWRAIALASDADVTRAAFDQLSGEVHASVQSGLVQGGHLIRNMASDRVRAAFGAVASPSLPVMAFNGEKVPTPAADSATHGVAIWGSVYGANASVDANGNTAESDSSSAGMLVGVDGTIADSWLIGAFAGYGRSSFDTDALASSADADHIHLGVYGGTHWGAIGLRTGLSYTWSEIDTSRVVTLLPENEVLSGSYDAGSLQVFGELGYKIDSGFAAFEPFVNLAHVRVQTDAFTETGGDAALSTARATTNTTFATLGVRASTEFAMGDSTTSLHGMVGWRHASGDINPSVLNSFDGSDTFAVSGAPIARNAAVLEAGVDFGLSRSVNLDLSYTGQLASDAQQHGFKSTLSLQF
jgi:fibronectin-binding autotransporter adhesin